MMEKVVVTAVIGLLVGNRSYGPGDVFEVEEDRARRLVEARSVVLGGELAIEPPPQTPADNPGGENAGDKPAGKESRKGK